MKAILISIKPKWLAKILNGEKTIEIRKTIPKCDLPIDVYIYCTKDKERLVDLRDDNFYFGGSERLNGKVVAKFTLKTIYLAKYQKHKDANSKKANELTCLTDEELDKYLNCKDGYGWGIDNLVIFDKPKELSEFYQYKFIEDTNITHKERHFRPYLKITKAPQSWQFIEV